MSLQQIRAGVLGLAVADALGVPVEFSSRAERCADPVVGMRGQGTYDQPAGTWSDDTSLALCLMESLTRGLDYPDIMDNFVKWYDGAFLTAGDVRFDVGQTTSRAIETYKRKKNPRTCGPYGEFDVGNGSLMRILPIALYLDARRGRPFAEDAEAMEIIRSVSALTHGHIRCAIACGIHCAVAQELLRGAELRAGIGEGVRRASAFYEAKGGDWRDELDENFRIDAAALAGRAEETIRSGGYVVDTLVAALWCLCTTDSYADCVLRAVNLGDDTDTVAAVAGGLAGLYYGCEAIPAQWLDRLIRRERIEDLCAAFARACCAPEGGPL